MKKIKKTRTIIVVILCIFMLVPSAVVSFGRMGNTNAKKNS